MRFGSHVMFCSEQGSPALHPAADHLTHAHTDRPHAALGAKQTAQLALFCRYDTSYYFTSCHTQILYNTMAQRQSSDDTHSLVLAGVPSAVPTSHGRRQSAGLAALSQVPAHTSLVFIQTQDEPA